MKSEIPFIPKKRLEESANAVLGAFFAEAGTALCIPVPVEEIAEFHFHLSFELRDLQPGAFYPEVLGGLDVYNQLVMIDVRLDPDSQPSCLGRFRFTYAHELGHWEHHRHIIYAADGQGLLSVDAPRSATILCREEDDRSRIEIQANIFASYLLMPEDAILAAWDEITGSPLPYCVDDEQVASLLLQNPSMSREQIIHRAFDSVIAPIATRFEVSKQAMELRLSDMGLLREEPEPLLFSREAWRR